MSYIILDGQTHELLDNSTLEELRRRGNVLVPPNVLQPWNTEEIPTTEGTRGEERALVFSSFHEGFGYSEIQFTSDPRSITTYEYAEGVDCRYKGYLLPAPATNALTLTGNTDNCDTAFEASENESAPTTSNTYVYLGGGTRLYKTTSTVGALKTFTASMTGAHKWEQQAVVGQGTGAVVQVLTTVGSGVSAADTWTAAADTDIVARALGQLGDNLYLANAANTLIAVNVDQTITAATVTTSGAFNIGDSSNRINDILGYDRLLVVGTDVGLWVLDQSSRGHYVTPKLLSLWSPENGRMLREWDGSVWATSIVGLLEYVPGRDRLWALWDPQENRSPVQGRVTAIEGHGDWLYVVVYNETDSYICAARRPKGGEARDHLTAHPLVKLAGVESRVLLTASRVAANPRLYYGNGVNAGYLIMPRGARFPTLDGNVTFQTSGTLYMGTYKGNPSTYKALRAIEFHRVRDADATRYWTPQYLVDGGTATNFDQQTPNVTGTGWQAKYVVDATGAALEAKGRQFELRLAYTSSSATDPPELELPIIVRFVEFPDHTRAFNALLKLSNPNAHGLTAATQMNNLRALLRTDDSSDTAVVTLEKPDDYTIGYSGGPSGSTGLSVIVTNLNEVTVLPDGSVVALVQMRQWDTS